MSGDVCVYDGLLRALTPGSVFCSWRALWAFSADSLAQYVRKAHPVRRKKADKQKKKEREKEVVVEKVTKWL